MPKQSVPDSLTGGWVHTGQVERAFELPTINRMSQAQRIDRLLDDHPARTTRRKKIREFILEYSSQFELGPPILDVGAGYRSGEPEVCKHKLLDFYTFDINPELGTDFVGDAMEMRQFPPDVFGTCLCTEVLEHVACPRAVVSEIRRVLTPGGLAIFTVPFWVGVHEKKGVPDYWRFTPSGVLLLLSSFIIELFRVSGPSRKPEGIFALVRKPSNDFAINEKENSSDFSPL